MYIVEESASISADNESASISADKQKQDDSGGIAGGVVSAMLVVATVATLTPIIIYMYIKRRKKIKGMERLQMDILTRSP